MKKVLSLMVVLALLVCGVVSVSAAKSPSPTIPEGYIAVDVVPNPGNAGEADSDAEGYIEIDSGKQVTITANPKPGYKFSHWEFITGQHTIISGKVTDPIMVIEPTGDESLLIYAHFVKEGEVVTTPTEKPSLPADGGEQSPTTGYSALAVVSSVVVLTAVFAVAVTLKKKQQG